MGNAIEQFLRRILHIRKRVPESVHFVGTCQSKLIELALQLSHSLQCRSLADRDRRGRSRGHRAACPRSGKLTWIELDFHTVFLVVCGFSVWYWACCHSLVISEKVKKTLALFIVPAECPKAGRRHIDQTDGASFP